MSNNPLLQLHSFGQSLWLDQMRRSLLTTGELKRLIDNDGLRGLTSNPTIFEKAISGSQDYAEQLGQLARAGSNIPQIYEEIVVQDIGGAADTFRGVTTPTMAAMDLSASKFLRCWPTTPRRPSKRPRNCSRA